MWAGLRTFYFGIMTQCPKREKLVLLDHGFYSKLLREFTTQLVYCLFLYKNLAGRNTPKHSKSPHSCFKLASLLSLLLPL